MTPYLKEKIYKNYHKVNIWIRVLVRHCSSEVCVCVAQPGLNQ